MNLPDFYSVCEEFDWSYLMAEDASEFRRGRAGEDKLIALADTPEKLTLLSGFKNHHYHPESHPKPGKPMQHPTDKELTDFFTRCQNHDWLYAMSDDGRVYKRGEANECALKGEAGKHPDFQSILAAWQNYINCKIRGTPCEQPQPPLTGQKDQDHMKKREIPQAAPVAEPVVGQTIWYFHPDERMLEAKIESITPEEIVTTYASLDRATDKFHVTRPDGDVYTEKSLFEGGGLVLVDAPAPAPKPALTLKVGDKIDVMHAPTNTWKGAEITSIDPNGEFAACRVEGMKKSSQYNLAMDTAPYRSKSTEPVVQPEAAPAPAPTPVPTVAPGPVVVERPAAPQANELAVPTQGSWFGGIGLNPEALRERPRVTFGQAVAIHMEKGIRLGDLALNEMILSKVNGTGPNGMGKEGDTSDRQIRFFVLYVRAGKIEGIPYAETEANPQLRARVAYTAEELDRLVRGSNGAPGTRYEIKDFADVYVLVEQPEGIEDTSGLFNVKIGDKMYAPATIKARNSSYKGLLVPISTIAESHRGKLPFFRFGVSLRLYKGKQMISVPDVARLGFIGEEHRAKLAELSASLASAMATAKPVDDDTPAT